MIILNAFLQREIIAFIGELKKGGDGNAGKMDCKTLDSFVYRLLDYGNIFNSCLSFTGLFSGGL